MPDPKYQVGDRVFVVGRTGPTRRSVVTAVKDYKRGPKVTCTDGSEWDPVNSGHQWDSRGAAYNTGPCLAPHSDELEIKFVRAIARRNLRRLVDQFDELTPEQQDELAEVASRIRRQRKS